MLLAMLQECVLSFTTTPYDSHDLSNTIYLLLVS